MTANTTEQERAAFEKLWESRGWTDVEQSKDAAFYWWQAARRAPVVPFSNKEVSAICDRFSMLMCEKRRSHISRGMDAGAEYYIRDVANYVAHAVNNAIASQSPEAGHIPDVSKMVAAPVQLPEPVAYIGYDKEQNADWLSFPGDMDGDFRGSKLYTEQQVRQLLAAHGIGKDKA